LFQIIPPIRWWADRHPLNTTEKPLLTEHGVVGGFGLAKRVRVTVVLLILLLPTAGQFIKRYRVCQRLLLGPVTYCGRCGIPL
jgi:hypothetical protein